MDIVLHLGAHHTGQAALLRAFEMSAEVMAAAKVAHLGPDELKEGILGGIYGAGAAVPPLKGQIRTRALGRTAMALREARQDGIETLHLSLPDVLGRVSDNLYLTTLYPGLMPRLRKVSDVIGAVDTVVFGICSYETYWETTLARLAKSGLPVPPRDHCHDLVRQSRGWQEVISELGAVFPGAEVCVWRYEDHARDLRGLWTGLTGLPAPEIGLPQPRDDLHYASSIEDQYIRFDTAQRLHLRMSYEDDLDWLRRGAEGTARLLHARRPAQELEGGLRHEGSGKPGIPGR